MKPNIIVIYFGELWLKGRNRAMFIDILSKNIKDVLAKESYENIENDGDRLIVHLNKKSNLDTITVRLSKIFGISWFAPCIKVKSKIEDIIKGVVEVGKGEPIRVEAHRSYKGTEFNSHEIVSKLIKLSAKSKRLKMEKESDNVIYISVKKNHTFICFDRRIGAQGLPVGASGKAIVLLSGGIDSPVSSFYAMKRGLKPIYLHMHGFSSNKAKELSKIKELAGILSTYSGKSTLYIIPSYIFQGRTLTIDRRYELVLFKRFMYKLAERISRTENADCIVTGESLGQVASQTIKNLESSAAGIKAFVIRPLIGMDKQEIINTAKRIETFQLSIKPYKDVCSIGIRNPRLSTNKAIVDKLYRESNLDEALEETLAKSSKITV